MSCCRVVSDSRRGDFMREENGGMGSVEEVMRET